MFIFQQRVGPGPARAAREGQRDRGARQLQHVRQPVGHRQAILRLHSPADPARREDGARRLRRHGRQDLRRVQGHQRAEGPEERRGQGRRGGHLSVFEGKQAAESFVSFRYGLVDYFFGVLKSFLYPIDLLVHIRSTWFLRMPFFAAFLYDEGRDRSIVRTGAGFLLQPKWQAHYSHIVLRWLTCSGIYFPTGNPTDRQTRMHCMPAPACLPSCLPTPEAFIRANRRCPLQSNLLNVVSGREENENFTSTFRANSIQFTTIVHAK